jgi:hypothetical protein
VDKAGATVLFEEANKGSNNIGVVATPVRLTSLGEFGSPQFVADKLIQAEKKKVKCLTLKLGYLPTHILLMLSFVLLLHSGKRLYFQRIMF